MRQRGINYDIGIEFDEKYHSRPKFDIVIVKRELEIIKTDLHCNAIRISGTDIERLITTAEAALKLGFEVWLSPHLHDKDEQHTLDYTVKCAIAAELLRKQYSKLIFILGCELTFFMKGILKGKNVFERLGNPISLLWRLKILGLHNKPLNAFLIKVNNAVRQVFYGEVTYSSAPIEAVDWSLFDFVCLDYYREARNRSSYAERLKRHFSHDKQVIITEFGCCTYKGAEDKGARGWTITDQKKIPLQIHGNYVRDEQIQAQELSDLLYILDEAKVDGLFVFTFISPALTYNEDKRFDLDMASYSLVKSYVDRYGDTYPDMTWEPKESFRTVARYFSKLI